MVISHRVERCPPKLGNDRLRFRNIHNRAHPVLTIVKRVGCRLDPFASAELMGPTSAPLTARHKN
jgi:hypothetical protein